MKTVAGLCAWYWKHFSASFKAAWSMTTSIGGRIGFAFAVAASIAGLLAPLWVNGISEGARELDAWVKWMSPVTVLVIAFVFGPLWFAFKEAKEKDGDIEKLIKSLADKNDDCESVVFLEGNGDLKSDVLSGGSLHYKTSIKNLSKRKPVHCVVLWEYSIPEVPNALRAEMRRINLVPQQPLLFDFLRINPTTLKWYVPAQSIPDGIEIPVQDYLEVHLMVVGDGIDPQIQILQINPLNGGEKAMIVLKGKNQRIT